MASVLKPMTDERSIILGGGKGMSRLRTLFTIVILTTAAWAAEPEPKPAAPSLRVRAALACLKPGRTQQFTVTIENPTAAVVKADVSLTVEHDLADRIAVGARTITVGPAKTGEFSIDWTPQEELWGCYVRAEAKIGDAALTARDVFAVTTNPLAASPVCQTILALNTESTIRKTIEKTRQSGALLIEHFNWQASTWGPVYPRKEIWPAGMSPSGRTDRKAMIPYTSKLVHDFGMKFLTYASPTFCGPQGYRWAKEHPEDVTYTTPDGKLKMEEKLASVSHPNTSRRETLDQGLDEYIKCVKEFGYDGVRWDGHPGVFYSPIRDWAFRVNGIARPPGFDSKGNLILPRNVDAANIEINRYMRKRLKEAVPDLLIGYNMGLGTYHDVAFNTAFPRSFAETARDSLVIDEKQMNAGSGDGVPSQIQARTWTQVRRTLLHNTDLMRLVGAYPYRGPVYAMCEPFAKHCYSLFFAAGSHAWGAGGLPDRWGRFALRFNRLLFHPSLVRTVVSGSYVGGKSVIAGAPFPVIYEDFAYDLSADGKLFMIMHLLNHPLSDVVNVKKTRAPSWRVDDARATIYLPPGLKPEAARFYALSPEWDEPCRPLQAQREAFTAAVNVPSFQYWAIVVVEFPVNVKTIIWPKEVENWFLEIDQNPQKPSLKR